jgi:glycosyltransferase involved in cell wall biosynthesis
MQKHSFYLAKYFAQNQIYVDLYHFNQSDFDITELHCFSNDEKKFINSIVIPFPKPSFYPGHYIIESYNFSKAVFEEFKKRNQVDFIYCKGFTGWTLLEEKRKGYLCAPVGVNFHGLEMFQKQPNFVSKLSAHLILKQPTLFQLNHADFVFSYGGKITELLNGLTIHKNRVIEIPTAIEKNWLTEHVKQKNDKLKFVFVGRYERRKGIEELNEVLKQLLEQDLNFEIHFIGPIPEKKWILNNKLKYLGPIRDSEKLKSYLENMDVLVCPSHSEGMPNVILEAMSSKLAIIATNVGAVKLMVNENNGLLIENLKQLKNAIIHFINLDISLLQKMQNSSFEKVKTSFLWENIIKQTIDKINLVIAKNKKSL